MPEIEHYDKGYLNKNRKGKHKEHVKQKKNKKSKIEISSVETKEYTFHTIK